MKGFRSTNPSQPRWADDETWDPGLLIHYWADKPDNHLLSTPQLARKSWCLFAIACWPRCSDGARVVRSTILFNQRSDLKFQYIGTKELNSLPVLSDKIGISAGSVPSFVQLELSKLISTGRRISTIMTEFGALPSSKAGSTTRLTMGATLSGGGSRTS